MNKIHPTLKFTLNYTTPQGEADNDRCECIYQDSIPFLDTSLSIENFIIDVDLFKKDRDINQYLLRESCHPEGVTASIPFSLSLRIVRICIQETKKSKRPINQIKGTTSNTTPPQ